MPHDLRRASSESDDGGKAAGVRAPTSTPGPAQVAPKVPRRKGAPKTGPDPQYALSQIQQLLREVGTSETADLPDDVESLEKAIANEEAKQSKLVEKYNKLASKIPQLQQTQDRLAFLKRSSQVTNGERLENLRVATSQQLQRDEKLTEDYVNKTKELRDEIESLEGEVERLVRLLKAEGIDPFKEQDPV